MFKSKLLSFLSLFTIIVFTSCKKTTNEETNNVPQEEEKKEIPLEKISLNYTSCKIDVGKVIRLKVSFYPENATNKEISWKVDTRDQAIAFNDGIIRGIKPGYSSITVTSKNNSSINARCTVIVNEHNNNTYQIKKVQYTYQNYSSDHYSLIDSCPTTYDMNNVIYPKILILPIWFSDSPNYIKDREVVKKDISNSILRLDKDNIDNYNSSDSNTWYSVSEYYYEESLHACQIIGTVANWYEVSNESNYYDDAKKTQDLIISATNNYFETTSDNKADYDIDNDGFFDAVIAIYGAPTYKARKKVDQSNEENTNLWAYCFWVQKQNNTRVDNVYQDRIVNTYLWASYDFMYDEKTALEKTGYKYGDGDCTNTSLDTHIYIHEFGHVFGLEDYYDYNEVYNPAGGFSMQDKNVGSHDPYSLLSLGWLRPYIPVSSCDISLSLFQDTREVILLSPSWNSSSSAFDEYLLLEFYSPTMLNNLDVNTKYKNIYPSGSKEYGIRLWHVDARLTYYLNKDSTNKLVFSSTLGNTPRDVSNHNGIETAMKNTYYQNNGNNNSNISVLGKEYSDYNILQLIRKEETYNNYPTTNFSSNNLFVEGDSFTMKKYQDQFVNKTKLNSKLDLGYTFSVKKIDTSSNTPEAIITINKLS